MKGPTPTTKAKGKNAIFKQETKGKMPSFKEDNGKMPSCNRGEGITTTWITDYQGKHATFNRGKGENHYLLTESKGETRHF